MNVFEDAGYFCVDNLPAGMIRSLAELFLHEGSKVERACVVSDLRAGDYFELLAEVLDELAAAGHVTTRAAVPGGRRGPAADALQGDPPAPSAGAQRQRRRRHPARARAAGADPRARRHGDRHDRPERRRRCGARSPRRCSRPAEPGKLAVTFCSFGHKHGPARDADLVLDVRFLPNPHWEPELRPLTGFDRRIVEYVGRDGRLKEFYDRVLPLLEYLLPQYVAEGKSHLVVAIGCTGGRHRSVVIAEDLAAQFRDDGRYFVEVGHRDVDRAPARTE